MRTHSVTFQVIGRTPFDVAAYQQKYGSPFGVPGGIDPTPFATGPMLLPDPTERGFKDTVRADPGYFTRIRARFDLPSGVTAPQTYVYHCHILEHEDNDMMRPFTVTAQTAPGCELSLSPPAGRGSGGWVLAWNPESKPHEAMAYTSKLQHRVLIGGRGNGRAAHLLH
jgi:hypothetical protein